MAMSQSTLATELENLTPADTEADAITALTDAYETFALDAVSNGVPITAAGVTAGKSAMAAALVGMAAENAGLTKIPAAIIAFWTAAAIPASFTGSTAVTPPPHTNLASDFATLTESIRDSEMTLEDAADALAMLFHTNAVTGGTATFGGTPYPIL